MMQLPRQFAFLIVTNLYVLALWAQQPDSTVVTPLNFDTIATRVNANAINYTTLGLRTHLVWNDGESEQEFMGSIRMQKDSVVWASLFGPFNIEGARLLISPDSFSLINRLAGEYTIREFAFLERWLYFPVSFNMLQQIMAGQRLSINEQAWAVANEDSVPVLYYETDKLQQKVWVHPLNYTITKILLKDKMLKQSLVLTFDAYNDLNGKPFSYKRNIEINRDSLTLRLGMDITKATLNENLQYPFEITDKYRKVE